MQVQLELERDLEQDVLSWCETHNILKVKLNLLGRKGFPDRLLVLPNGVILWVEFKRKGKRPEKHQDYIHRELRKRKQHVYVATDYNDTISYIQTHLDAA